MIKRINTTVNASTGSKYLRRAYSVSKFPSGVPESLLQVAAGFRNVPTGSCRLQQGFRMFPMGCRRLRWAIGKKCNNSGLASLYLTPHHL